MAKPRVFISSTFYDLKQTRTELNMFFENMGYEPVLNEEGDIPYGKDEALEEYCYKEIKGIDILISIVGGRFGSESKRNKSSVSQMELRTAIKEGKQVYIFVEKNILSEYETYLLNKESEMQIKFRYVDDIRIYKFIEEIKGLSNNNNIKEFETTTEITRYLKEQLAGLFQRFLEKQTRVKEISLISNLEKTAQTLNKLVNFLSEQNKGHSQEINRILFINHPLVEELRSILGINYNFYIEGKDDLSGLLSSKGYKADYPDLDEEGTYLYWIKDTARKQYFLKISENIFDEDGRLKFFKKSDWKTEFTENWETEKLSFLNLDDDLPF